VTAAQPLTTSYGSRRADRRTSGVPLVVVGSTATVPL
jgi:hypothetical protein